MMNLRYLYIIMSIFSLLALPGCRDEEAVQTSEGTRTVTVNLGIAMSRATLKDETTYGPADDMKIWIFDEEGNPIAYAEREEPPFSIEDLQGNLVESVTMNFEINGLTNLQLRVLLNTDNITLGSGLALNKNTKMSDIDNATFTLKSDVALGDNTVPMYGKNDKPIPIDNKKNYDIDIKVTRAVSKLELFFTKESESAYLKINNIKLEQIPNKGYINGGLTPDPTDITYDGSKENILSSEAIIEKSLSGDIVLGNFRTYEKTNFDKLTLTTTYLLENVKGGTWSDTDKDKDYTYPYDPTSQTGVTDETTRYKMTVTYQTTDGGESKEQVVYLPAMKRNEWNKIFARVKEDNFAIALNVLPWEDVKESQIGWDPNLYFSYGGNAPMTAWRMVKVDEDDDDSPMKIDPNHRNAMDGDEEATCCYVLYPRYGRSNNQSDHGTLVARSSYAAFYFCMQEPKGAVWEAYLSNPDDFELSTGGSYDSNQDGVNDKCCVMTGIAREEPYQIQVGARHAWTNASDRITDDGDEGEDSGWDDLTDDWGKIIEENDRQYNIYTDLRIRVSLDNGVTWNDLKINPSDYTESDKEDQTYYLEHTYWHKNRRFAGDDYYIRIWQLKAEKGEESFVNLVEHLKQDTNGHWAILDYWKGTADE